ncbi:MAG TPA: class I SAM-dependent methyltransferase [Solirubrobacterales bacterium]|jgi:SAM-dependent methyltransferase|nr:class I SAM-dependent methyltransferase [Solirubrobacterales bacterium]
MSILSKEIPQDWYATAFDGASADMAWTERTESEVNRALKMLRPEGDERILDLACGSGRHTIELARRGFTVVGADISPDLIEIANRDAGAEPDLAVSFVEGDLRELDFEAEFDIVLNLNDGAIGYFESEDENHRTFEVISRALRPGGRNLIQLPNVLYAKEHLPQRSWIPSSTMVELVEHRWNKRDSYMEGVMVAVRFGEVLEELKGIEFRQRLYTVDELRALYASVGMDLASVFHGSGKRRDPTPAQFEVFLEATKLS